MGVFGIQEHREGISVCNAYYLAVNGVLFYCGCWATGGGT